MSSAAGTAVFLFGASDALTAATDWLGARVGDRHVVWCATPDDCARIDRLLWVRKPLGFTPHCGSESPLADETPIVITADAPRRFVDRCLVNLSGQLPDVGESFRKIVEVVTVAEHDRQAARGRFRHYKAMGYQMESVDLAKGDLP